VAGPLTGNYDFEFSVWNAAGVGTGTQQGSTITTNDVAVSNGIFTVTLDFGPIFTGSAEWLDIEVRTNGTTTFFDIGTRQELTPVPYAIYATSTATAASATSFTGSLSGDVTGSQSVTVVAKVGGQTAANVATGVVAANAATNADVANTIVKRDSSGNFTAGTITAAGYSGNGSNLANLTATSVTQGMLPVSVLPSSVAQLGSNQTFTGVNTFSNNVIFSPGNGTLVVTNDGGIVPGLLANGGNAPGHARFRNELEIWPNPSGTTNGYLDVRNTSGTATITLTGQTGAVVASSFSGNGSNLTGITASTLGGNDLSTISGESGVSVGTNIYLNNNVIYLRNDQNHGLAYNGGGITNFPDASVQPDGPVLWGYTGGALGSLSNGAAADLSWNNSTVSVADNLNVGGNATISSNVTAANVTVTGILSAANTPGVNYFQTATEAVNVPANGAVSLGSMGNAKPGTGVFVISAYAEIAANESAYSGAYLQLYDVTSGQVLLNEAFYDPNEFGSFGTVTLNWVVPITAAGGFENYGLAVESLSSAITVEGHNLTVMYFPRQNN
jgi:hypothetical protein